MRIDIRGIAGNRILHDHVEVTLRALVTRLGLEPLEAQASFVDQNGTKGGVDIRCGLNVKLPRRPLIHAEDLADTARLAFDAACAALGQRLAREQGRGRKLRRRPKKYFVAQTLLEEGLPPQDRPRRAS